MLVGDSLSGVSFIILYIIRGEIRNLVEKALHAEAVPLLVTLNQLFKPIPEFTCVWELDKIPEMFPFSSKQLASRVIKGSFQLYCSFPAPTSSLVKDKRGRLVRAITSVSVAGSVLYEVKSII